MNRPVSKPPELALPVASLRALRTSLAGEVGDDAAARALRAAGHAAGDACFAAFAASSGARVGGDSDPAGQLGRLGSDVFWRRFGEFFATRGWGHLRFSQPHDGVGALEATDWVEADAGGGAERPSCHFTTGLLANMLGNVADREIAVLEVECRSSGDERCLFLFGARESLEVVHGDLATGSDFERAMLELA